MDGANSIELVTTQVDKKKKNNKSEIAKLREEIPDEALKLFEGK